MDGNPNARPSGGSINQGRLIYQNLYSLRLLSELLDDQGPYDAFGTEHREGDFHAWNRPQDASVQRLLLVEVKTSATKCVLRTPSAARGLAQIKAAAIRITNRGSKTLTGRLVYNRVHDCKTSECAGRMLASPLAQELRALGVTIDLQPYLSLSPTLEELQSELHFLERFRSGIIGLLANPQILARTVRNVLARVAPFHCLWPPPEHFDSQLDSPFQQGLSVDRESARRLLSSALDSALEETEDIADEENLQITHGRATALARTDCAETQSTQAQTATDEYLRYPFHLSQLAKAEAARSICAVLSDDTALLRLHGVSKTAWNYIFELETAGLVPLRQYLESPSTTHRCRVQLILGYLSSLVRWAAAGVTFLGFRWRLAAHFVRVTPNDPQLVTGDIGALCLWQERRKFLDKYRCRAAGIAEAIKILYYSTARIAEIQASPLFQFPWNDNVVLEFCKWLEAFRIVDVRKIQSSASSLFKSELNEWPLVVTGPNIQFSRDLIDCGKDSLTDLLIANRPARWLSDRGEYYERIVYAISGQTSVDSEQVGLLSVGQEVPLQLYRYFPYRTRRWSSMHSRDRKISRALSSQRDAVTLAFVDSNAEWRDTLQNIYGIEPFQYISWLHDTFHDYGKPSFVLFPAILRHEALLHRCRQATVNHLRRKMFVYTSGDSVEGDSISLRVSDSTLLPYLSSLGYTPERYEALAVNIFGMSGARSQGRSPRIQFSRKTGEITITFQGNTSLENEGTLSLSDPGTDYVIRKEQTLFNELRDSFDQDDLPAGRAWRYLQPIVGGELPRQTPNHGVWRGKLLQITKASIKPAFDTTTKRLVQEMVQTERPSQWWKIVTGAPGTGKTRFTAGVAGEFLKAADDRAFPAARVLVVCASHWAVDNYVRTFHEGYSDVVVHRYVSHEQWNRRKNDGRIDCEMCEALTAEFDSRVAPFLPEVQIPETKHDAISSYRTHLLNRLAQIDAALSSAVGRSVNCLVPSHARWRLQYGMKTIEDLAHLRAAGQYLREKLHDLEGIDSPQGFESDPGDVRISQRLFAAQLVAVTIDSLPKLPDVRFELVIVEEASQVSLTNLLKVMSKVMRASMGGELPHLVLCGDPQQLSPFIVKPPPAHTEIDAPWSSIRRTVHSEPLFSSRCRFHAEHTPGRVVSLTVQCRMHPQIAQVINSLFYSHQIWTYWREEVTSDERDGVWWIDTEDAFGEPNQVGEGFSLLNPREVQTVELLLKYEVLDHSDVLIISPYSAQVRELKELPSGQVSVRTIDSSQGIEAKIVIVSLVQMSQFPLDMRRLNVALSRARDRLYIIGSLDELKRYSEENGAPPHAGALVSLFGVKGPLEEKVISVSGLLPYE